MQDEVWTCEAILRTANLHRLRHLPNCVIKLERGFARGPTLEINYFLHPCSFFLNLLFLPFLLCSFVFIRHVLFVSGLIFERYSLSHLCLPFVPLWLLSLFLNTSLIIVSAPLHFLLIPQLEALQQSIFHNMSSRMLFMSHLFHYMYYRSTNDGCDVMFAL